MEIPLLGLIKKSCFVLKSEERHVHVRRNHKEHLVFSSANKMTLL